MTINSIEMRWLPGFLVTASFIFIFIYEESRVELGDVIKKTKDRESTSPSFFLIARRKRRLSARTGPKALQEVNREYT